MYLFVKQCENFPPSIAVSYYKGVAENEILITDVFDERNPRNPK